MKEEVYIIKGMHCAACSSNVERVTRKLDGVKSSSVNLTTNKMNIIYDESKCSSLDIIEKVEKAGFKIELYVTEEKKNSKQKDYEEDNHLKRQKNELIFSVIFSVALLYVSMGQMFKYKLPVFDIVNIDMYPQNLALTELLLSIPILYFGRSYFINGFRGLIHLNPSMDTLVAIGSGFSFAYSVYLTYLLPINASHVHHLYYESAAIVITFIMIGKYLESKNKEKTKGAIKKLMDLSPDTSLVFKDGNFAKIDTKEVLKGDILLVKPGAKVPLDGIVTDGETEVDEAMITGESMPVFKKIGSKVIGGSINYNGSIKIKVTEIGRDTVLSKIIKLVEDAQGKKAPIAKIADKVAGIFVPIVMSIAFISSIIWLFMGYDMSFVIRIFTSVLVIACPCSLGLATPTSIMVGTGIGASNGILIRSGEALESMHNINAVVFDKTGTITEGKPKIVSVVSKGINHHEFLAYTMLLEQNSNHPLSKPVVNFASKSKEAENFIKNNKMTISEFKNIAGKGLSAYINGKKVLLGNKILLEENNVSFEESKKLVDEELEKGYTVMCLSIDGVFKGLISLSDIIKESSKEALHKLKLMNIETFMITGDNKKAASHIGAIAQIKKENIFSEVLPFDKAKIVEKIKSSGKNVMMVGDGINDAPALAAADIGTSIGSGTEIAIESGSVVLMKSDLNDVHRSIKLSKMTITNIKQNLFWAFFYNIIGIPIAAGILYPKFGILLNPMIAGLAMSLSSVCVVGNALRLRRKKL